MSTVDPTTFRLTYKGKTHNYDQVMEAIDFHDLSRNMEMREINTQLGISMSNPEVLENFFVEQATTLPPSKVGSIVLNGQRFETRDFISEITGPSGKKAVLESRWTVEGNGDLVLGTVVPHRPEPNFRTPKNQRFSQGEFVDRIPIYRIIIILVDH